MTWTGSIQSATEIIDWVLSLGGTARYHGEWPDDGPYIAVDVPRGVLILHPSETLSHAAPTQGGER